MQDFGVVYIHSGGLWADICELSKSTLPKGTLITTILAKDHKDHLTKRLTLCNNLPYKRTLYLDCDTVYCSNEFPEWLLNMKLYTGIGMSAWLIANQLWSWPSSWRQYLNSDNLNLPHWFRVPNAGLMVMESHASDILHRWLDVWESSSIPLIEPTYILAFRKEPEHMFDIIPPSFHIPSVNIRELFVSLPDYYFVHAITNTDNKIKEMERILTVFKEG